MTSKSQLIILAIVLGLISEALGHSYLTSPTSRSNQKQTTTGCRGPACLGPCDAKASSARSPVTIARGASVSLQWPRNNHAGGFIRVAWAPTAQSDTHAVFDANVQEIVCHERGGCKPDSASDPNGGDSGPADGSVNPCAVTITVPPHLTDGLWTLQWAWFGGAFALGDYYSCVDYKISGGASGSAPTPVFIGGDYTYPGQAKCKFFNTDRLHRCVNEPCDNPVYALSTEKSGPAFGIAVQGSTPTPTPPPASTTAAPAAPPAAATTGKKATSTSTSTSTSSGTHTGATSTSTSGSSQTGGVCGVQGYMKCASPNSYQTCTYGNGGALQWSAVQGCQPGLSCNPSGNYIYCY